MEIRSVKENLAKLFYYTCELYDGKRYPDFEAVYQFILDEEGDVYRFHLAVAHGKAVFSEGDHDSPSLTVYSPASVWLDVASGRLNGAWGWLTGKYRIQGRLFYLRMFRKVFGRKIVNEEKTATSESWEWRRPGTVLIVNGSPRKKAGFTYQYLRHFITGMERAGAATEVIDIYDAKYVIEPCRGCFSCWIKSNGKCIIDDDANGLIKKMDNADLLVYAFPLYIDSIPAKLKALMDRQFIHVQPVFVPYDAMTRHPVRDCKGRALVLFSVNGFPEFGHFKPLIDTFKGIARNWNRQLLAAVVRPGAQSLYVGPPYYHYLKQVLTSLERGGRELIETGKVSKKLLKAISNDFGIPGHAWRNNANLHWLLERNKNADNTHKME